MKLIVERKSDNGVETLGTLSLIDNNIAVFKCVTLELPDKNNQQQISCIPKNTYKCSKVGASTNIPYKHIAIENVPNRSGVCIHKANYVSQLRGCIAVGKDIVDINGDKQLDITASGITFDNLMALLPDKFELEIK
jgi:hypothetical protein